MSDEHIHGTYVETKRFAKMMSLEQSLCKSFNEQDRINRRYTQWASQRTDECKVDPDAEVNDDLRIMAKFMGMEAFVLQHMMSHSIPQALQNDEFLRTRMKEILVYVKLRQAEDIAEFRADHLADVEAETQQNVQASQNTMRAYKDRIKKDLERINNDLQKLEKDVMQEKQWLVSRVNRALALTGGRTQFMSRTDQNIVNNMEALGLVVQDGPYRVVHQDKIVYMDDLEFCKIAPTLITAQSSMPLR